VARPDTILAWDHKLVARKFDGSKARRGPGRPRIKGEVEQLIVRMAKENRDWGYDRIAGALANLGYKVCDQTVGNVLQRHALPPAPERTTTWPAFIRIHLALLAGTDFLTAEVLTLRGLVTYYVLFFIHLESRRVDIAGITVHPDERWMQQMARNVTMEGCGALRDCRYLLHDRDTKYTQSFGAIIASGRVEPLVLPARSPNLNAYAERWVRSVKEECRSKVILFGEPSLRLALSEYISNISMPSGITRGRAISCCSLGVRTAAARGLFNAASDWADSCVITIRRQRERGEPPQMNFLTLRARRGSGR
jgi:putative transposase